MSLKILKSSRKSKLLEKCDECGDFLSDCTCCCASCSEPLAGKQICEDCTCSKCGLFFELCNAIIKKCICRSKNV